MSLDPIAFGRLAARATLAQDGRPLDATIKLPHDAAEWLHVFLADVLNDDFMGAYQRKSVGPVPGEIVAAFDLDAAMIGELFNGDDEGDDEGDE